MTTRFEDILSRGETLYYTNVGDSMMPLIKEGRDVLIIEPKPAGRLKRDDVPLYKRDSGQYVLHRIVKVRDEDYLIRGDNRYNTEKGIQDRHIIGLLTGIIRDGKVLSVTDAEYLLYVKALHKAYPLNYVRYKCRRLIEKTKRLFA